MSRQETEISSNMTPDTSVSVRDAFGIDQDLSVPAFSERSEYVPEVDDAYLFDRDTTLAILAGFTHNRRVMVPVSYTHLRSPRDLSTSRMPSSA